MDKYVLMDDEGNFEPGFDTKDKAVAYATELIKKNGGVMYLYSLTSVLHSDIKEDAPDVYEKKIGKV